MKEKIYANYKVKKPYNIFLVLLILGIIASVFVLITMIFFEMHTVNLIYSAFLLFLVAFQQKGFYEENIQTPIIYFNIDEIILNYRSGLIIKQEEIESFKIKKKRTLKLFLKDKKPVSLSLYYLTYQKIDYLEAKLNEFVKN